MTEKRLDEFDDEALSALIDGQPRSARATAKTDCKLARIDERRLMFLIQQTPNFGLELMRILVGRLRRESGAA